jgi:hypothetical protein
MRGEHSTDFNLVRSGVGNAGGWRLADDGGVSGGVHKVTTDWFPKQMNVSREWLVERAVGT